MLALSRRERRRLAVTFALIGAGALGAAVWWANAGAVSNTPPVLTGGAAAISYTENDAATVVDAAVAVSDADGDPIASATVQISGGLAAAQDVLRASPPAGITASYDAASGTLTLTGVAPAGDYTLALASVAYANGSDAPSTATRTLVYTAWDALDPSNTVTSTVDVVAVDDGAQVGATAGSLAYAEGAGAVPLDTGATIVDPEDDISSITLQVTGGYMNGEDQLGFADGGGVTSTWAAATGTLTLSGSGGLTSAAWQAALRAVTYTDTSGAPSAAPRTVTITVRDPGTPDATATRVVAITPVNDPPAAGGDTTVTTPAGAAASITEDAPAPAAANIRLTPPTLADADGPTPSAVRVIAVLGGTLAQADGSVIGLGPGGSILALTTGRVDLRFTPAPDRDVPATFTYVVVDGSNPAVNSSASVATVPIAAVDDPPALTASSGAATYTEGAAAVSVDPGITVSDVDSAALVGATVQLTSGYAAGEDVLALTPPAGLAASYAAATGTLTITGSASSATYRSALRAVTYVNGSDAPDTGARTVTFAVSDSSGPSAPVTRALAVTATNDAPIVGVAGGAATYTENDPPVAVDPALTVADADSATLTGATVAVTSGYASGTDALGVTPIGGITAVWDASTGRLALTGPAALATYATVLRSVTFVTTSDAPSTAARTLAFAVDDGTNVSSPAARTMSIVAVDDPPVLGATGGASSYTEGAAGTALDTTFTIADVDDAAIEGAVVALGGGFVASEDVLTFTPGNGITGTWDGAGTLTLAGSASIASYEAALRSVVYTDTSDAPTVSPRDVRFSVDDGDVSSNSITRTVTPIAVNDPPTVTVVPAATVYVENDAAVAVDATLTVDDRDDATLLRARVRITSGLRASQDLLRITPTAGITTITDAANGEILLVGPAPVATFQSALRSAQYANTSDDPTSATRTVELVADDGRGWGSAATRQVLVAPVDDAPSAQPDVTSTRRGVRIDVAVLTNDSDVDDSTLRVVSLGPIANGSATIRSGRVVRVVPAASFTGWLRVRYTVADPFGAVASANVHVHVVAPARPSGSPPRSTPTTAAPTTAPTTAAPTTVPTTAPTTVPTTAPPAARPAPHRHGARPPAVGDEPAPAPTTASSIPPTTASAPASRPGSQPTTATSVVRAPGRPRSTAPGQPGAGRGGRAGEAAPTGSRARAGVPPLLLLVAVVGVAALGIVVLRRRLA